MKESRFFKSVNLQLDLSHPDRLAHFHPTSKSVNVMQAIVQGTPEPASIIVAAYGSGKSIAAGVAALMVDNGPKAKGFLKQLAPRLGSLDGQLGKLVAKRAAGKTQGLPILLEGHQSLLPFELALRAKTKLKYIRAQREPAADIVPVLDAIAHRAGKQGMDRIAIVWDEFGRHLEALASSGRAEELAVVQRVAEWAVRQAKPAATFCLLLHQNVSQYTGNLNQAAKSDWRKIEGRFSPIHYVEDSNEIYELIATVVSELRPEDSLPTASHFKAHAKKAVAARIFKEQADLGSLSGILQKAHPLTPATLYMLPRMASRLAQNERTIFSFLQAADLSRRQSLLDLYRFFSPSMEADSGLGGTHRRWLETESALSKVSKPVEMEIIAATALLGLGVSGERARVSHKTLNYAVAGQLGSWTSKVKDAIASLTHRKLLLHGRRNDDISIWHGTDTDIRFKLENERARLDGQIDMVDFLEREYAAPSWLLPEHNLKFAIRRYYRGKYVDAQELARQTDGHPVLSLPSDEDGRVVYCLAETSVDISAATKVAKKADIFKERLLFAIPKDPLPISDLVSEITALRNLQRDADLISADPFVESELQHMIDAAHESLGRVLGRLVEPDARGCTWFTKGRSLTIKDGRDLRVELSKFANKLYWKTPRVNNELVVRRVVSRPMVNARKKLILGILERSGKDDLGFDTSATTPDVALYRTVLARTGLYSNNYRGSGSWARPVALQKENPGLASVWSLLEDFFQTPGREKTFSSLIQEMVAPPFGTRMGVMPILIAAGLQAFGRAVTISRQGTYLADILASEVEAFCTTPDEFLVDVYPLSQKRKKYLSELAAVFGGPTSDTSGDMLRQLYDAVVSWKAHLPPSALSSRQVSKKAQDLQLALTNGELNPAVLAFDVLPAIAGTQEKAAEIIDEISALCQELEGIVDRYTSRAIDAIRSSLALSPDAPGNVLERARDWSACFSGSQNGGFKFDRISQAVLSRSLEASSGRYSEASFARALSAILLGRSLEQWDDASSQLFTDRLRDVASSIEHAALMSNNPSPALAPLLKQRIEYLKGVLHQIDMKDKDAVLARPRKVGKTKQ